MREVGREGREGGRGGGRKGREGGRERGRGGEGNGGDIFNDNVQSIR